ncbi:MAG: Maf family protein [Bryobacteraceae bacterium]|nr:Maf family protein [Bryobacteraceae bacterium]
MRPIILASASPRRAELLRAAGIPFTVRPADVDESIEPGEDPLDYVRRLAHAKAMAIETRPGDIVLAADTTVTVDGEVLGKPADREDAARMLRLLSGRVHEVHTGICLASDEETALDSATTQVWFAPMSDAEIAAYVATGEPMDKAGAYGIQGAASKFAERIEGCYFNVVGLPVELVWRHLRRMLEA